MLRAVIALLPELTYNHRRLDEFYPIIIACAPTDHKMKCHLFSFLPPAAAEKVFSQRTLVTRDKRDDILAQIL